MERGQESKKIYMKIAMIGQKKVPSREGGIEIVVGELAARMVKKGHQVDAYNRWEAGSKKTFFTGKEYRGIRLLKIPTLKKSFFNAFLYSFFATVRAVWGRYDVLHYHAEGSCAMMWIPKILGIPTVATIHGLDWKRAKWGGFASWYLHLAEKAAVRFADEIIVVSRDMQKYFKEIYGRNTHFINNGITVKSSDEPELLEKYGLTENEYILYLGRIVPEKGIHYLIDAYKKISTAKKLVICGSIASQDKYVEEICKMASEDERIVIMGFVEGQLLEELYSNCSVYVLPSDIEGMAISLLEALSYGAKCLVSDIPENKAVTGAYAAYFQKGNVENLRKQLELILEEKIHFDIDGEIMYLKEHYGWPKVVEETLKIYEIAIEKKKSER